MAGRKPAFDPSRIINAILHFKDRVIDLNGSKKNNYNYILYIQFIRLLGL
jgi:hypothetical protein